LLFSMDFLIGCGLAEGGGQGIRTTALFVYLDRSMATTMRQW